MKTLNFVFSVLFMAAISVASVAQANDHGSMPAATTESFKVWGKCEMCKARIEKTAKAEGATSAVWDLKSHLLIVTYDPSKTSKDAMSKKLAAVGHDTEKYKAADEVYAKLPACCHYDRAK